MKQISRTALLILLVSLVYSTAWADKFSETKQMFEEAGVSDIFNSAYGYALFPTIGKVGFVIGGAFGKGRVYKQGDYYGDTNMTQASIGFQLGGSGFSQVVFFKDQRAFDEFTTGSFEFGMDVQVVALTAAAGASGSTGGSSATASGGKNNAVTDGHGYNKGMATYTIVKGGLLYDVSVGGQAFSFTKR